MTAARAVLFDLDDTLYRLRRFTLSGFRAVARQLAREGFDERIVLGTLVSAYRRSAIERPFQALERRVGGHHTDLLAIFREHAPSLRLPPATRRVLEELRHGWRLAVVTNGPPDQQRRKIAALGIAPLVDTVCYAHEISPTGKPDPLVFHTVLARLGVAPTRAIMVGDDAECDIAGARGVGCLTIHLQRAAPVATPAVADAVALRMADVPAIAARLFAEKEAA